MADNHTRDGSEPSSAIAPYIHDSSRLLVTFELRCSKCLARHERFDATLGAGTFSTKLQPPACDCGARVLFSVSTLDDGAAMPEPAPIEVTAVEVQPSPTEPGEPPSDDVVAGVDVLPPDPYVGEKLFGVSPHYAGCFAVYVLEVHRHAVRVKIADGGSQWLRYAPSLMQEPNTWHRHDRDRTRRHRATST